MRRRLALPLALLIAFAPGCKGMGGIASGLGKVAAGAARGVAHVAPAVVHSVAKAAPAIARGVAHAAPVIARGAAKAGPVVAHGVARVGGEVARGVARSVPTALRVGEAIAETVDSMLPDIYLSPREAPGAPVTVDPCEACPLDDDCGACAGYAGYACVVSPAGALARCESSAPPDAPPVTAEPEPAEPEPAAQDPAAPDPSLPPPGAPPSWFVF